VSFGIAVYPEDGATIDALFQAADRALYEMKQLKKTA
jgi:GGDEF domain-containing protein